MDGCPSRRWSLVLLSCLCAGGCAGARGARDPQAAAAPIETTAATPAWQPTQVAGPVVAAAAPGVEPSAAPPYSPYLSSPYSAANQTNPPPAAASNAASAGTRNPANEAQALQQIMAELQSLGNVDPAVQQQLLADLRQTDPALWPMLMQTFRAGVTYRQRGTNSPAPKTAAAASPPPTVAAQKPTAKPSSTPNAAAAKAMLEAAATSMNPGGKSTPGLAFPATALLGAALAQAQQQEADAAEPPPPAVETSAIVKTASHERPFATIGEKPPATKTSYETTVAAADKPATDWQTALAETVELLEAQTSEPPTNAQEVHQHAWHRILCLAAGRRDDALKPIPGIAAAEQDYWTEQIFALATYLDSEKLTDPARRSAAAAQHLSKATARLREASTLTVKNLAFCTEVNSYGVYQKFKGDEFKAGQALILYAEVENFKSEESTKGFHTALRSSYQILDAQGRRVAENDLALTEEFCQNQRRDYFIRYFLSVPERIYAGKYTLQLTIVDSLSQKIGQSTVDFTIVEK